MCVECWGSIPTRRWLLVPHASFKTTQWYKPDVISLVFCVFVYGYNSLWGIPQIPQKFFFLPFSNGGHFGKTQLTFGICMYHVLPFTPVCTSLNHLKKFICEVYLPLLVMSVMPTRYVHVTSQWRQRKTSYRTYIMFFGIIPHMFQGKKWKAMLTLCCWQKAVMNVQCWPAVAQKKPLVFTIHFVWRIIIESSLLQGTLFLSDITYATYIK